MFIAPYMIPSTVQTLPFDSYNSSMDLTGSNALILSRRGEKDGETNHVAQGTKAYFLKVLLLGLTSSKFKPRLKRK